MTVVGIQIGENTEEPEVGRGGSEKESGLVTVAFAFGSDPSDPTARRDPLCFRGHGHRNVLPFLRENTVPESKEASPTGRHGGHRALSSNCRVAVTCQDTKTFYTSQAGMFLRESSLGNSDLIGPLY